jgi:NAD(P)H-flavin reductase
MGEPGNPMRPLLGTVAGMKDLADEIKLFQVELNGESFDYQPGQFAFLSAFGVGEAPFGLASTTGRTSALEFAVNQVGTVTSALHSLARWWAYGGRWATAFRWRKWRERRSLSWVEALVARRCDR